MSHSNVTKEMSGADVNSEGKPYHQHGDKIEKKKHEPSEHPEAKDITPHHGHDNQFHKDLKGSVGSGSSERGDRKADKETS
ncbi:unnamed protein product [Adineta steineri]|uniref:Uncharacterized protein n=2 Tax=Adineta steineri TaxID=433720 RepID=A0A814WD07_9BILA|nr:unnamed protein product [Adineta steineri]CAF1185886.1 unnamed protein product [Adineta steineri]CAF1200603.1 unnamed protein product [Adineta steineri]CAF3909155.1 unnamed protein product [Adineta steineri]CAF4237907.1 unnamed protein product [Adineta steineri]